jgi:hypothetical protein
LTRFLNQGDLMQLRKPRFTYANVVATLALFFALCGGAAFAANTIRSGDIAPGAVQTADIHSRAITSGKLAVGAVRGNQISPHSVGSSQIAPGSIGRSELAPDAIKTSEIAPGSIRPDQLQVPVSTIAEGSGGAQALPTGSYAYPLSGAKWTQQPGETNLIMAELTGTLAFDGNFPNGCRVIMRLEANGNAIGSLELGTQSTQMLSQGTALPVAPVLPPSATRTNEVTASFNTFGCTPESQIDSVELQVLGVG